MLQIIALSVLFIMFTVSISIEIIQIKKKDDYFKMAFRNIIGIIIVVTSLILLKQNLLLELLFCLYGILNIVITTIKMKQFI